MSSSNSSEYSSDPSDDESTSTSIDTKQKSEVKQESPHNDKKQESSEEESSKSSDSTPPEKTASKTKEAKITPTQNKKEDKSEEESSEESSTVEESSDESSSEEETSEPMDDSSSKNKKSQPSKATQKPTSEKDKKKTPEEKIPAKSSPAHEKPKATEKKDKLKSSSESDEERPTEIKTREVKVNKNGDTNQSHKHNDNDDNNNANSNNANNNDTNASDNGNTRAQDDGRKMDRYGWYVDKKKLSKQELQLIQIESQKEGERTQKWLEMTKNWSSFMKKNRNKVASRIKKGVPDSMRSRVWALLCQAEQTKKQYPTPMSELLKKPKHQGYVTIDKDLSRTFPQIGFFSKPGFIESLRRILYCYCQTDPVLGYTQGMSFIAGMFLSYMDEETAFYSFLNVMLGKRLNQRGYFLSGFPRLDKANLMLACLMDKKCPKILKKMDSLGVIMSMFTPGWFLTVYQSYTWQPEFQLRLFERYLFYGTRGLLNFGIVIILYHQKILEKADMEEFLRILQHPDSSKKMLNWHSVLQEWDKNWLNKAEYEKLLTRCGVQKETENY